MGAAALPIAAGAAVVGSGVQAYGSLKAGQEEARATQFEQQQLEQQSEFEQQQLGLQQGQFEGNEREKQRILGLQSKQYRTQAAQQEAARREELTASLETLMALRASRGVGSASPTGRAITDALISDEISDIRTERANAESAALEGEIASGMSESRVALSRKQLDLSRKHSRKQLKLSAANARRKAKYSMMAGYVGAGTAIAGGISGAATALSKK